MGVSTCPDAEQLLDYSVGKLSLEQCEAVEDHLDNCQTCSSTIMNLDDTRDALVVAIGYATPTNKYEEEPAYRRGFDLVREIARNAAVTSKPVESNSKPRQL